MHCHWVAPCSRSKLLPKSYGKLHWNYRWSHLFQHSRPHMRRQHRGSGPVCGSRGDLPSRCGTKDSASAESLEIRSESVAIDNSSVNPISLGWSATSPLYVGTADPREFDAVSSPYSLKTKGSPPRC